MAPLRSLDEGWGATSSAGQHLLSNLSFHIGQRADMMPAFLTGDNGIVILDGVQTKVVLAALGTGEIDAHLAILAF